MGEALRLGRELRGLSREAMAARAGLHPKHLARIERGQHSPTVSNLLALLGALGEASLEHLAADFVVGLVRGAPPPNLTSATQTEGRPAP
ncbi:MAG: helix-turn-helix transcriptional regulator [Candidatus Dormibacteraeota bacterium]|nr:helix-turn-helix transcriptional regulator [Candidatus Dormibacteraeota bacterium]